MSRLGMATTSFLGHPPRRSLPRSLRGFRSWLRHAACRREILAQVERLKQRSRRWQRCGSSANSLPVSGVFKNSLKLGFM